MAHHSEKCSFKDMKVGQAFLYVDSKTYFYGIKVSADQYFNFSSDILNRCYLKDAKYYVLCDYEVW